jgi:muconate cycloisomerase
MNLKIVAIEVIPVSIPLKKPMYMSGRCITHAENILVKIEAGGIIGWGEAASAPRMTGDTLPGMLEIINRFLSPVLIGKNIKDYSQLSAQILKTVYGNTGAKSAVNSALLDLVSRIENVPLYTLLGTKKRDNFNSMRILGNKSQEEDIAEAEEAHKNGVDFFKIKVGKHNIVDEIEQTYKIRNVIGNSKLCVDANAGLGKEDLRTYVEAVKNTNLLFLEQPFDEMIKLDLDIPICMDESIFTKEDLYLIKNIGAGQGVNLKNIKLGGPLQLIEAANLSEQLGLEINISAKVAETGIATSTMLHCAAVSPSLNWGFSTTNQYLITDIIKASKTNVLEAVEIDEYILKDFIFDV